MTYEAVKGAAFRIAMEGGEVAESTREWLYEQAHWAGADSLPVQPERRTERPGPQDRCTSVVYYVRFCCRVKIGTTTNLAGRLQAIPHDELIVTEKGDHVLEKVRHKQFEGYRVSGEWFTMGPALVAHMRALKIGGPSIKGRLVSTGDAVLYTGRDRQTLYRWANEGRVTKYGDGMSVRWDILELPAMDPDGPVPPPPPVLP